jgi:hypothetical protein
MLINRDHRPWAIASAAATLAGMIVYAWYVNSRPYGPSGGSWVGIVFGILGTTCMVLAGLLAGRKKFRIRRIGSAQFWMRMHIWLSIVAVPFILFHAGFRLGGPLTFWLMVLFFVVTLSGLFGLAVQQLLPSIMTSRVPLETLHSQIDFVGEGLAVNAYASVAGIAGAMPEAASEIEALKKEAEIAEVRKTYWKGVERPNPAESPAPETARLRDFYLQQVRPYLQRNLHAPAKLPSPAIETALVDAPEEWTAVVQTLAALCEESRQLEMQMRLHRWLHGWLFLHAPIAFAMFVLAAVHIVVALSYKLGG